MPAPAFKRAASVAIVNPTSPQSITIQVDDGDTVVVSVVSAAASSANLATVTGITNGGNYSQADTQTTAAGFERTEVWRTTNAGQGVSATSLSIAFSGTPASMTISVETFSNGGGYGIPVKATANSTACQVTVSMTDANGLLVGACGSDQGGTVWPAFTAPATNRASNGTTTAAVDTLGGIGDKSPGATGNQTIAMPAAIAVNWAAIAFEITGVMASTSYAPRPGIPLSALLIPCKPFGPQNPLREVRYTGPPAAGGVNTPVSLDVFSTFDPILAEFSAFNRTLSVAAGWTISLTRGVSYLRTLSISAAWTVALTKVSGYARPLAVSSTFTAALQRGYSRALNVASTFVAGMVIGRAYSRALAVASTFVATLTKSISYQRALAVTSSFVAALTRQAAHVKTLAVTSAFVVALQRGISHTLAVASTFTVSLTRQVSYQRTLAVVSTFAPMLSPKAAHLLALAVAATFAVALTVGRGFFRTLAATSTLTATITRLVTHTYLQALAATSTFAVSLARKAGYQRLLSVPSTYLPTLSRIVAHPRTLAVVSPMVAALQRGIAIRLVVASLFVATLNRAFSRALAVISAFVAVLTKGAKGLYSGFLTHIQAAFPVRAIDATAFETRALSDAAFEVRRSK